MKFHTFLLKYGEIGLKGKNRYLFEDALVRQIRFALKDVDGNFQVHKSQARIYVDCEGEYDYEDTVEHLQRVFGLVGICPVVRMEDQGFEQLKKDVVAYMDEMYPDKNLTFKVEARRAKKYLIDNFGINVNAFDIVTGYRADDSYFDYAESFLNNAISVEQLAAAMKLGKLGEQIVLKSQFAFSRIRFEGFDVAEKEEFYVLRKARDDEANRLYLELLEEESDGLYIQDIIRGGITNDDSRIPRNISE